MLPRREHEVEKILGEALKDLPIGNKLSLNFNLTSLMDVEMLFEGGWEVRFVIHPGEAFELTKGDRGLLNVVMNIRPEQAKN